MKAMLRAAHGYLALAGIDPLRALGSMRGLPTYLANLRAIRAIAGGLPAEWPITRLRPCLTDRFEESGNARGHYFHQDLLVAQRIFERQPQSHFDVGSRIDGLVAHVASFRPITILDIRPLQSTVRNVSYRALNLMAPLPPEMRGVCDSLSCLHALEHLGLGRYGDPVHPDGHRMGLRNLHALLQPQGVLYLSVPMGPQRIEFDAHRVFALSTLLSLVRPGFDLLSFSYVDDPGDLHTEVPVDLEQVSNNFGCSYGCAILELQRLPNSETPWPT